jgi:hypothetical protein
MSREASVLVVVVLAASLVSAAVPSDQMAALRDLFDSTSGAAWVNRTGWNDGDACETRWFGVTCAGSDVYVHVLIVCHLECAWMWLRLGCGCCSGVTSVWLSRLRLW